MKKFRANITALVLMSLLAGIVLFSAAPTKASASFEVVPLPIPFPDGFTFITLAPLPGVTKKPPRETLVPDPTPKKPEPVPTKKPTNKPSSGGGQLFNNEGPLFLSFNPDLTEKLLMFTPMDLSQDAETRIPLIGDEKQVVGEAKVTVRSGMVIVSYLVTNGVKVNEKNEFFTFFSDIRTVSSVDPRKLQDAKLRFGIPYNIQSVLGSDARVLLYINTPASFNTKLSGLTPFSFEDPAYIERMMDSLPLMD